MSRFKSKSKRSRDRVLSMTKSIEQMIVLLVETNVMKWNEIVRRWISCRKCTIQRQDWMVKQISFIAGVRSLNEQHFRNNFKFFKVPETSFDSIRTKLTMKIFKEYSNMLRYMYSIRTRRRGILNLIYQYHLGTRWCDNGPTVRHTYHTFCSEDDSLPFIAWIFSLYTSSGPHRHDLYSRWHVFLPIFNSKTLEIVWTSISKNNRRWTEASGGGDVSHLSGASGGGAVSRHSGGKRSHHVTSQREGPVHHLWCDRPEQLHLESVYRRLR